LIQLVTGTFQIFTVHPQEESYSVSSIDPSLLVEDSNYISF